MSRYTLACKIREFMSEYTYQTGNTFFTLATLDRLLSTQRSIRYRQWSNRLSLAYKLVVGNIIFWLLLVGHRLVYYNISNGGCGAQEGAYAKFDAYLEAFLSGVCSPISVIVLTFLLLQSARSVMKRRVAPDMAVSTVTNTNATHFQRIDSQLTRMLLLQSLIEIIAYVPYGAAVLYSNITDGWSKSSLLLAWEQLIINICRMASYLFAATGFYVSMISNRGFREQFMRSFGIKRISDARRGLQITNTVGSTHIIQ